MNNFQSWQIIVIMTNFVVLMLSILFIISAKNA